jgi:hypothetical protein
MIRASDLRIMGKCQWASLRMACAAMGKHHRMEQIQQVDQLMRLPWN